MATGVKRVITLILVFSILFSFAGCGEKDDVFEKTNDIFFSHLLARSEENEIQIKSLDAYKMGVWCYYNVVYSQISPLNGELIVLDMVYFGAYDDIDAYFNLNWNNFYDLEGRRDAYFVAKEQGEHKAFSQEEINQYVTEFFQNKDGNNN